MAKTNAAAIIVETKSSIYVNDPAAWEFTQ